MLPELNPDPVFQNALTGSLDFDNRQVSLRVDPDDATIEECLASAARAVDALSALDRHAREAAARSLLAKYNDGWRRYSTMTEDGKFVDVESPVLTAPAFMARLKLTSLEALGANTCTLLYDDDRLFAGHSVEVTSFDGLSFTDVSVQLLG